MSTNYLNMDKFYLYSKLVAYGNAHDLWKKFKSVHITVSMDGTNSVFNYFNGWSCNAGYQGIIIREPDGSVKRSYSCHDVPLGNIETGFKLFDSPMPCITESCVSSADSKIPKRKINDS